MSVVGTGIDLVEVARIARMLEDHGDRFLARCFTPAEAAYARTSRRCAEHLAARFAAKEATLKALGTGLTAGIAWTDIEVVRRDDGAVSLRLSGPAANAAAARSISRWHLSLTHTGSTAAAIVVAESAHA